MRCEGTRALLPVSPAVSATDSGVLAMWMQCHSCGQQQLRAPSTQSWPELTMIWTSGGVCLLQASVLAVNIFESCTEIWLVFYWLLKDFHSI